MTRPTVTGINRRPEVTLTSAPPSLAVVAPMNVQAAPSSGALGLAALSEALGVAGRYAAAESKRRGEESKLQGVADRQVGKVDTERQESDSRYAEGVYEASVISQFEEAKKAVLARAAAGELDHELPYDQRAAQLDRLMKEELGDLVKDDPTARRLIGERYSAFLADVSGKMLQQEVEQQVQRTVDVTVADTHGDLVAGGSGRFQENVERIAEVTGDRSAAVTSILGAYAQAAIEAAANPELPPEQAEAEAARILASIPETTGVKSPTPVLTLENREALSSAQEQITRVLQSRRTAIAAEKYWDVRLGFEKKNEHGIPITESEVKRWVDEGVLTDDQGISILMENRNALQRRAAELQIANLFATGGDWTAVIGTDRGDGVRHTPASVQKSFNDYVAQFAPEGQQIAFALQESARHALAWEPLKARMNAVSPANPEVALALLDEYKQIKAAGLAGMYVSEEAQAIYEHALDIDASGTASATPEGRTRITQQLRNFRPEEARPHIQAISREVRDGVLQTEFEAPWFGENVRFGDFENAGYVQAEIARLTRVNGGAGLPASRVQQIAADRIKQTHYAVSIDDSRFLLPRAPGVNPEDVQGAVELFSKEMLPQYAAREGLGADEVTFEIAAEPGGRGVELVVVEAATRRQLSDPLALLESTRSGEPAGLIPQYLSRKREEARRAAEEEAAKPKTFSERLIRTTGGEAAVRASWQSRAEQAAGTGTGATPTGYWGAPAPASNP